MASLAATPPLHRWAILPPRPRDALLKMVAATKGNETEMSHALGVQADSTGEWGGGAVSFATKADAMAYIC
jgi:hypothetical protein